MSWSKFAPVIVASGEGGRFALVDHPAMLREIKESLDTATLRNGIGSNRPSMENLDDVPLWCYLRKVAMGFRDTNALQQPKWV